MAERYKSATVLGVSAMYCSLAGALYTKLLWLLGASQHSYGAVVL